MPVFSPTEHARTVPLPPPPGADRVKALLGLLRSRLNEIEELYKPAHESAYGQGGGPDPQGKVPVSGYADPVGELATDDVTEEGSGTQMQVLRTDLRTAGEAIAQMVEASAATLAALNRILLPADAKLPKARGLYRWTVDDARAAEARAQRRKVDAR